MKSFNKYHFSIGSNIGDRLQNLQNAIDLIHLEISIISSISPIYKTKAVGFNGDDFYNICISFFSNDDPNNLLQSLLNIEGNIGAGKTSLAKKISIDFNSKLILERFADNPFLPKFYEDPDRYAFTLEMSFLAERYQQITDDLSQLNIFNDSIVSDYDIFKSLIFSKITLSEDEFALYRKLFFSMYKDILKPDLYIYLNQNIDRLKENIKKRGRDYEQNIDSKYLKNINSGYLDFHKTQTDLNIKIIDINNMDFVNNRIDYLSILKSICQ